MGDSVLLMILLQVLLIALNAFFACAEIAFISVNETKIGKLAEEGDKRAIRLQGLTSETARFLSTIQIAITLSGFLGSAFAAENFSDGLVDWLIGLGVPIPARILDSIVVILITLVLSYFTLVFGELVPKQVAMRNPEKLALSMSGLISGIAKLFAPIVFLLTHSTNGVLRLMGIDPNAQEEEVGEEEIRMMVDAGSEKGTIDHEERDFIQNVFDFDNLSVEEIIVHRRDVTVLDLQDDLETWEQVIGETLYTYYPVCDETPDKIVGILNTKMYFRLPEKTREEVLEKAVKPAYVVPESLKADVLFRNMKRDHAHFAVVMDEYGGMSGIITIKDLIEELVGEMEDDVVPEKNECEIEQNEDGTWTVDGGMSLEDLSEALGITLDDEDYDTLNGLIFHAIGSLPEEGTTLDADGLHIRVTEVRDYQVKEAVLALLEPEETDEEEAGEAEEE